VVAQIYGVGLITTRLTGVAFELGIFLGLGGILVCSFLGGMRAVTWTQVAQYIILIIAYMIPVVWLSVKQTSVPIPAGHLRLPAAKGHGREDELIKDPKELEVRKVYADRAAALGEKLKDPKAALAADREAPTKKVADLKATTPWRPRWPLPKRRSQHCRGRSCCQNRLDPRQGRRRSPRQAPGRHAAPRSAVRRRPQWRRQGQGGVRHSRRNFLALIFCLMVGTAALPHILMRYYTTPSVKEARESVTWSLFFIFLLYFTAPALAVLVKYEVFNVLVGTPFDKLPAWIASWARVDPAC
jgi:cation/acetate symporter